MNLQGRRSDDSYFCSAPTLELNTRGLWRMIIAPILIIRQRPLVFNSKVNAEQKYEPLGRRPWRFILEPRQKENVPGSAFLRRQTCCSSGCPDEFLRFCGAPHSTYTNIHTHTHKHTHTHTQTHTHCTYDVFACLCFLIDRNRHEP